MARPSRNFSESLQHKLNSYALAASAAGVGVLTLAPNVEAKVIYTPVNVKLSSKAYCLSFEHERDELQHCNFILDQGTVSIRSASFFSSMAAIKPAYSTNGNAVVGRNKNIAIAFEEGAKIGGGNHFRTKKTEIIAEWFKYRGSRWWGEWVHDGKGRKNGYLGLSFKINNLSPAVHYGWARVSVTIKGKHITAILTGYAYETVPNKPIIAGRTKGPDVTTVEPGSLGHLARGADAIPAWRIKQ